MEPFTRDDLRALLAHRQPPCVSLFVRTTHGSGPEGQLRWKNQLRGAEERLHARGLRTPEAQDLLRPARDLLDDVSFWTGASEGVALFLAPGLARCWRLPVAFEDQAFVSDRFHLKPVLSYLAGVGRFFVLALHQDRVRLLECTPRTAREVDLRQPAASLGRALRHEAGGWRVGSVAAPRANLGNGQTGPLLADPVVPTDGSPNDRQKYFQAVDHALQQVLQLDQAALVLAGDANRVEEYRKASPYPRLLEGKVEGHLDRRSAEELRDRAHELVQARRKEAQERTAALYRQLAGTGRTVNDPAEVVPSAYEGRLQFLFVPCTRELWGTFDPAARKVEVHAEARPGDDDLLNLAAVHTLAHGGTVYALEPARLPDSAPLSAIYWLPGGERSGKRTIATGSERGV
jgi:hypothetical protein